MSEAHYKHLIHSIRNGVLVLTLTDPQLRGDELAEALRTEMLAALEAAGTNKVVLNMRPVMYLSSVTFRPLLQLHARLKETNGRIVLCNLSPVVSEVLAVTRMISTSRSYPAPLEVAPDVDTAVASLADNTSSPAGS